jgi:hypothetical protein
VVGGGYSARLQCADPVQAQEKTPANFILRPGDPNQISVGLGFESRQPYQRFAENKPAAKQ